MFLWLKTLYRKRAVTWPFIFYTIIWTLSKGFKKTDFITIPKEESIVTSNQNQQTNRKRPFTIRKTSR
ncbi:hypothetical protein FS851_14665 [Enterococcus durans]|nr:hypothetical protein FS851_14665 [Enterococcus durans]